MARERGRIFRRPPRRAPAAEDQAAPSRPFLRPSGVRAPEPGPRHLRMHADFEATTDPDAARRAGRHDRLDLLRSGPVGVRPDAGAVRRDRRHAARCRSRDSVLRHDRRPEARERYRARRGRHAPAGAGHGGDRDLRLPVISRPGVLPAAAIWPRWPRVHGLQVPHDDRVRGRPAHAGDALRPPCHAGGCIPASHLARRAADSSCNVLGEA